ncbi:cupin domain-containing protein [Listeria aquatica]|uniref:Cupin type-2 domain-containing protein n=1 Tax=Listeria aquatica FSL S10-1188 TaxID=1265818 RepID=W7BAN0_9LIST|nr:cupin domain-containing protein [Listeria aquatica]EUJ19986.1 hypothetical protein MAQA_04386 [Listeria aquatica FSL S10-1188]
MENRRTKKDYGELEVLISPSFLEKSEVFVTLCTINPKTKAPVHVHDYSQEHIYIIEGEGDLVIENEIQTLTKGDIAAVPMGVPHTINNEGEKPLKALLVMAPVAPEGHLGHRNI